MKKMLPRTRKLLCNSLGLLFVAIYVAGCVLPSQPLALIPNRQIQTQNITLGSVQSRIKPGTSSATVVDYLGSPNIVTTNDDGSETWVYDKLSTEHESALGYNSAVSVSSSRTLIVTIKYDLNHIVKDVKYRQTSY